MKALAIVLLPPSLLLGFAAINAQSESCHAYRDTTWEGRRVLVERCTGSLGLALHEDRIIERY